MYSKRVVTLFNAGENSKDISEALSISLASVYRMCHWVHVEENACATYLNSVIALKSVWDSMYKDYMESMFKAFRHHIEAFLAANGGVIEK